MTAPVSPTSPVARTPRGGLGALPWGESHYDTKTFEEVLVDYLDIRGDLTEQYARDQLADWVDRLVAHREEVAATEALAAAPTGADDAEGPGWSPLRIRVEALIADISLPPQFRIVLDQDREVPGGRLYLQIEAERIDTYTGCLGFGRGGKAYLSQHATDSEIIQTAWGLYQAYVLHEARETFLVRGRRVFGPHIDTAALWEVAERYDARPASTQTGRTNSEESR